MIQAHFITNINIKHQTITCDWCWTFQKLLSTSSLLFPLSVVCYDYQLHLLPLTITRLLQTQLVLSDLPLSPLWKCWVLLPSWKCWVYYTYCYGIYALVSYHPMYTSTTYSNNYHRAPYSSPLPLSLSLRKMIKVCLSLRFSNSCLYTVLAWMTCEADPVG